MLHFLRLELASSNPNPTLFFDEPETVWPTLQWPVHTVEKLSRQGSITVWATQGTQTGCLSPPHCVLCDLLHLLAVQVSHWYTGSTGRTNQLLCEELEGLCWVYHDTGFGEGSDLGIFWCSIFFTCIPTGLAIQVACQKLEEDPSLSGRTDLSVDDIVGLLTLCLKATLSFRRKVHQQVHGTAMGSPVSIVIANLVMEGVEERAFATFYCPPGSGSAMWMTPAQPYPETWLSPSTATWTVLSCVYHSR